MSKNLENNLLTTSPAKGFGCPNLLAARLTNRAETLSLPTMSPFSKSPLLKLPCAIALSLALALPAMGMDAQQMAQYRDHINHGNMLLKGNRFQDALSEYEAAKAIEPSNHVALENIALAHNNWGIFLFHSRKYQEAKQQWEMALKLNPQDAYVRRNLKILEAHLKQMAAAEERAAGNEEKKAPPEASGKAPEPPGKPRPEDWDPLKESAQDQKQAPGHTTNEAAAGKNTKAAPGTGATANGSAGGDPSKGELKEDKSTIIYGSSSGSISGGDNFGGTSGATIINSSHAGNSSSPSGTTYSGTAPAGGTTFGSGTAPGSGTAYGGSTTYNGGSSPGITNSSTIRIIGGNTGSASIVGSGSSSSGDGSYGSPANAGQQSYYPGYNANFNSSGDGTITVTTPARTTSSGNPSPAPVVSAASAARSKQPARYKLPGSEGSSEERPTASPSSESKRPISFSPSGNSDNSGSAPSPNAPAPIAESGNTGGDGASTVDDILAKIENKVYGKVSKKEPILKRLEKLEVDTLGKKCSGSIADRLKVLKETYGF